MSGNVFDKYINQLKSGPPPEIALMREQIFAETGLDLSKVDDNDLANTLTTESNKLTEFINSTNTESLTQGSQVKIIERLLGNLDSADITLLVVQIKTLENLKGTQKPETHKIIELAQFRLLSDQMYNIAGKIENSEYDDASKMLTNLMLAMPEIKTNYTTLRNFSNETINTLTMRISDKIVALQQTNDSIAPPENEKNINNLKLLIQQLSTLQPTTDDTAEDADEAEGDAATHEPPQPPTRFPSTPILSQRKLSGSEDLKPSGVLPAATTAKANSSPSAAALSTSSQVTAKVPYAEDFLAIFKNVCLHEIKNDPRLADCQLNEQTDSATVYNTKQNTNIITVKAAEKNVPSSSGEVDLYEGSVDAWRLLFLTLQKQKPEEQYCDISLGDGDLTERAQNFVLALKQVVENSHGGFQECKFKFATLENATLKAIKAAVENEKDDNGLRTFFKNQNNYTPSPTNTNRNTP